MTYAMPTYTPPIAAGDPTSVMGRRIAAYLVDGLIPLIAIVIGMIVWFGAAQKYDIDGSDAPYLSCAEANYNDSGLVCFDNGDNIWFASGDDTAKAFAYGGAVGFLGLLNVYVLQGVTGATIGKRLLGIRVVKGDGSVVGFGGNLVRSLLFVVDGICGGIVGLVTASVSKNHRRVGDMVANTFVVRASSVGTPIVAAAYGAYVGGVVPPPVQQYAPPVGQAPTPWGTTPPVAQTAPAPVVETPELAPEQAGWGAPAAAAAAPAAFTPAPEPEPAPAPAPAAAQDDPTVPKWDEARQAYIAWEPSRNSWMQHDAATNEWRPIS